MRGSLSICRPRRSDGRLISPWVLIPAKMPSPLGAAVLAPGVGANCLVEERALARRPGHGGRGLQAPYDERAEFEGCTTCGLRLQGRFTLRLLLRAVRAHRRVGQIDAQRACGLGTQLLERQLIAGERVDPTAQAAVAFVGK